MKPKADPEAMSEKDFQKGSQNELKVDHFGDQNRSNIDEQIDAKSDAKKVLKNNEQIMQKVIKI